MTLRIIAGKFKGRLLKTPKNQATRPTQGIVRAALFNICQNQIENARFLDLFAGSGAMGLEALSRGASSATFVEENRQAIACIKENIAALHLEAQTELISCNAHLALQRLTVPFDLIYLDPPYDIPFAPFIEEILSYHLLTPNALLFAEEGTLPKRPYPSFAGLREINTRRFGTTLLHQYQLD